jgi:signal transduction histidine kinase
MNLKFRFALLFTLLVAVILSGSMAAIYLLYHDYRKEDFFKRVEQQAVQTYSLHFDKRYEDSVARKISIQSGRQLYEEADFIIDESLKVVYNFPDTAVFSLKKESLFPAKEVAVERFTSGEKEGVIRYFPQSKVYVVTVAYDRIGIRKLENLQWILFLVCLGAVGVTAVVSFYYAGQITRPLTRLSEEIANIGESNLTQRVRVGKLKDELSQIGRNFNEMLNRLEKAFNIQKSFVHHASHELRTPLASMLAQTESALRTDLNPATYKKVLESLKEDQQGLIDLTNSLLSLSQFEKIAAAGEWPEIRVDELLYETMEASRKLFPGIDVSIGFEDVPDDQDLLCVKGNEALLKSAFINLVKNAYRYSDNRKVEASISASLERVLVVFSNTGKQIPPEERSRLFIPFFRGQNAIGQKGFGLGLSIVNRIIHLHLGTVHYEAEGENMNRFVVEFIK